jgi:hypothetical protein
VQASKHCGFCSPRPRTFFIFSVKITSINYSTNLSESNVIEVLCFIEHKQLLKQLSILLIVYINLLVPECGI